VDAVDAPPPPWRTMSLHTTSDDAEEKGPLKKAKPAKAGFA